jgi:hypothetical protein
MGTCRIFDPGSSCHVVAGFVGTSVCVFIGIKQKVIIVLSLFFKLIGCDQ